MSLQVWLPLRGDLNNYGVSGASVTNNGATVNDSGKIGKCYTFDGTDDYMQFSDLDISSKSELSITFWCYAAASLDGLFAVRNQSGYHEIIFSSTQLSFRDSEHSSIQYITFTQPTANIWTNYAIIYDNGSWIIYKNGIEIKRATYSTPATLRANLTEIRIGRKQTSSANVYYNGKINDFRIYDHALSTKEVKEISKGLCMHYKLDFSKKTGGINLVANGWRGTTNWEYSDSDHVSSDVPSSPSGMTNSFWNENTTLEFIPLVSDHLYALSVYMKQARTDKSCYFSFIPYDIDKNQIMYRMSPGFMTNTLTTLAQDLHDGDTVIYLTNTSNWSTTTNYAYYIAIFGYADSTGYIYPDLVYTRKTYQWATSGNFNNLNTQNNTITLLSAYHGDTIPAGTSVCQAKNGSAYYYPITSEANTLQDWTYKSTSFKPKTTPYLQAAAYIKVKSINDYQYLAGITLIDTTDLSSNNMVEDCSGYMNHGSVVGDISNVYNSPRNKWCVSMQNKDTTNRIECPPIPCSDNIFSVSFWVKIQDKSGKVLLACKNKMTIGMGSNYIVVCPTTNTKFANPLILNEWNHILAVRNGDNYSLYINGEVVNTLGDATYFAHGNTNIWLLNRNSTSTNYGANAEISDLRVYASELTLEDAKEFYNTAAYVHNTGALSCYEFAEIEENLLKRENVIKDYVNQSNINSTCGTMVIREGVPALKFKATDTWFTLDGVDHHYQMMYGMFKQNTQYLFDLWIDGDDMFPTSGDHAYEMYGTGFAIKYVGVNNSVFYEIVGDRINKLGWQHKLFITDANKTIESIGIIYHINSPLYVRADSFIVPLTETKINKNGTIESGLFVENTDVAFIGKGDFNAKNLLEI